MDIVLLGQSFRVSTDEDDRYLSTIIDHYRSLIGDVQRTTSASNDTITAILAGLLAIDEYYKLLHQKKEPQTSEPPVPADLTPAHARTPDHPPAPPDYQRPKPDSSDSDEARDITNSILSKIDEIF